MIDLPIKIHPRNRQPVQRSGLVKEVVAVVVTTRPKFPRIRISKARSKARGRARKRRRRVDRRSDIGGLLRLVCVILRLESRFKMFGGGLEEHYSSKLLFLLGYIALHWGHACILLYDTYILRGRTVIFSLVFTLMDDQKKLDSLVLHKTQGSVRFLGTINGYLLVGFTRKTWFCTIWRKQKDAYSLVLHIEFGSTDLFCYSSMLITCRCLVLVKLKKPLSFTPFSMSF
jgi:hypothetical protein